MSGNLKVVSMNYEKLQTAPASLSMSSPRSDSSGLDFVSSAPRTAPSIKEYLNSITYDRYLNCLTINKLYVRLFNICKIQVTFR